MSSPDLRSFLRELETRGELARVRVEVDPDQEITIIQHRVQARGGPALLFERVKGSPYRLVSNLFGTPERVALAFGGAPEAVGQRLVRLAEAMMPPSPKRLWQMRREFPLFVRSRLKPVASGPVLETVMEPADLNQLPVLKCWPEDGGHFFTLPLVHTVDPVSGKGNMGIYRLQRYDAGSTGMHWQIEKGGGFHFQLAGELGRPLPVSVFLGGPPALTIAAVAPLPEGIDERLLAAMMIGAPLNVISRKWTGHRIPAEAEFVLEGTVTKGDVAREGPFGDHFGHYSHSADFPVFRVKRVLARRDAIYPATVVGKPVQEDFHIGAALQDMALPLLKIMRPAVTAIWAYPETGFHPLAVMAVKQRYPREALKHTLGMLGEGQVSLTKIMITVDHGVDVKDFKAVSTALWRHLDLRDGLHLVSPTAQDTLDFTGPAMNSGSRLVLIACRKATGPVRDSLPPEIDETRGVHRDLIRVMNLGPAFLLAQLRSNDVTIEDVRAALEAHPAARQYLFHVLLSPDIPMDDPIMIFWGWFTRFDPLLDIHPADRRVQGNRLEFDAPIVIDARWKEGYPKPVEFDPTIEKRVSARWRTYHLPG
ncbi:UbiD family decarboxylase associated with menaquinone via futalosine [Olavius algarvensis associated proteobacterium Delta 3]|nr:UbiD family decarboxylase associated with menaquinone via futalosine [Olavius algarvensis associated proteobacterium Delta 3]CAB5142288.1 UbiD family decarboxylase associated with menaquinone via futalosine [Olavius algarvensis associated proteobacterium Delta 3]